MACDQGDRKELLEIFAQTSFRCSPVPCYSLASGAQSKYYIDAKMALSYPEARKKIGKLIDLLIEDTTIDSVGGMELGAYPIAVAVSDAAYDRRKKILRAFVVRKQPKKHGLAKLLEGDAKVQDRVLIVDDVVTTGASTIAAIKKSRESDLVVVQVVALVDRQEAGGRENIEALGVKFQALFTLQDLIEQSESLQQSAVG